MTTTVLITSAGSASALNVITALRRQRELPVRLVAVDQDPLAAGLHLADVGRVVPPARDPGYVAAILELIERERVRVALPILSLETPVFAGLRAELAARGVGLLMSSPEVVATCNDKRLTARHLTARGLPHPRTWLVEDGRAPTDVTLPAMVKAAVSSGSRGVTRVDDRAGLEAALRACAEPLVQAFVEGPELTVDCLGDREGRLIAAVPRRRVRVAHGKSTVGRTVDEPDVVELVRAVAATLPLSGPWNLQCIRGPGGPVVIELNPRFAAGGLPLAIAAGADLPLLAVKLALGLPVAPITRTTAGLTMIRYTTEVIVPDLPAP